MLQQNADSTFSVSHSLQARLGRTVHPVISGTIDRMLGLSRLHAQYRDLQGVPEGTGFATLALERLAISWHVASADLDHLPATGPVIAVCNHPFGAVEGILLAAALGRRRQDLKIIANQLLRSVQELQQLFIPVDVLRGPIASRTNAAAYREARHWLSGGGMLAVFPAGAVAHLCPKNWLVTDPPWQRGVARLVRGSRATVVPVYFPGANGRFFQGAGLLHPRLRTALLPRELLNKKGRRIEMRVGPPVAASVLERLGEDERIVASLRFRTYALAGRGQDAQRTTGLNLPWRMARRLPAVAPPAPRAILAAEIAALPAAQMLASSGEHEVWCVDPRQTPELLREIGRLREITFRLVGEGTGRALDLDRFDAIYRHLILWDSTAGAIAGAYRLGETDRLLKAAGTRGLYTSTLFAYEPGLFHRLGPSLELGRSFVTPDYQKSYGALLMLWKGIGRFLVANPSIRNLFGPVSISQSYQLLSRELMVSYLKAAHRDSELESLVRPRTPIPPPRHQEWNGVTAGNLFQDLEDLGTIVADIEPDRKGVPILIKQYLKLGARVVAFNRDPRFSEVWDCLLRVDLRRTPDTMLARYMGRDGLVSYRAHHVPLEEQAARIA